MNKFVCIFAAVSAAVCPSLADMVTHEIEGEVKETCVAAVGLHPFLYSEATKGRENALASELRIYEDGTAVPYVIRRQMIRKQPAPTWDLETIAEIVRNAETKTTTLDFETFGMPLSAVGINTKDENFSRTARVLVRRNGGWARIADGRIKVVNLPGKKEKSLEISLGREVCEPVMRIELDDGDNPPVLFEKLAVSCKIVPYDAAFIAKPGKKYELRIEQGADLPRYDQVVREYIAEVKDPVRLDYKVTAEFGVDGPTAIWLTWNPIPTISLVVFVLLAVVCFWLFKSTGKN